ncbi:peptidase S8/S53 domain-containing protein [Xylariales sp. PMI_506]|nr:peptidase S8/S53 domain-containing protein [Xylariales sp. PMI_506]
MQPKYLLFMALLPFSAAKAPLFYRDVDNVVRDNYIVVMHPNITRTNLVVYYESISASTSEKISATLHRGTVKIFNNIHGMGAFHVECDATTLDEIRNHSAVHYVAQDAYVSTQAAMPNVRTRQPSQPVWGLGRISHRHAGINEYVDALPPRTPRLYSLDTGILLTHEEFGGRAVWGANFIDKSPDIDENGHGTHTAATSVGNTVGVDNSTIPVAVKCLDKNAVGTWSGVMAAIDWAVGDARARDVLDRSVINMSIGGPAYQPIDDMITRASATGVTVVVAASNYGADASAYSPARCAAAITVAAIDQTDTRPSWSNYGAAVDIFAPGVDITSAWMTGKDDFATMSGTSMGESSKPFRSGDTDHSYPHSSSTPSPSPSFPFLPLRLVKKAKYRPKLTNLSYVLFVSLAAAAPHVAGLATYLMSREGISGSAAVRERLVELATAGMVQAAQGSANLIAFNNGDGTS